MPRKFKPQEKQFGRFPQIWDGITMDDWLAWLIEEKPHCRFHRQGAHLKGCCPFHDDPRPSFAVTPSKGMAKCFGCQRAFSNPVRFVAAIKNCSFAEALVYMRKRFGLKGLIPDALHEKLAAYEVHQDHKRKITELACTALREAIMQYPNIDPSLAWTKDAVEWCKARNFGAYAPNELRPADDVDDVQHPADPAGVWGRITMNQMVGTLPPPAYVTAHFGENSEEVLFFRKYFSQYLTDTKYIGSIMLMLHDGPDSVASFKLRIVPEGDTKNFVFVGDQYVEERGGFRGYFGLHYYRIFLGSDEAGTGYVDRCAIVEGEGDVLASVARQIRHQSDDFIILSGGGASVQTADHLKQFGIDKVDIIADNDSGGEKFIQNLLERTSTNISFRVFQWPDEYITWRMPNDPDKRIKDPDDAVKYLGYPKWRRYVNDNGTYQQAYLWIFDHASDEIAHKPPDDVKQRGRVAMEWGKLIKDNTELQKFCGLVQEHYELDQATLFRDIRAKDEDEEAFVGRMVDVLRGFFHFVGMQNGESRKRILVFYDKATRKTDSLTLNDEKALEAVFAHYFGPIYAFVQEHIGEPAFLTGDGDEGAPKLAMDMREKRYRQYINYALLKIAQGLPSLDRAPTKAQGLHFMGTKDGVSRSYMVNGLDVYEILHEGDKMSVTLLDGPSHNGVIFDTSGPAWLHSVKSAEDIMSADVDVVRLFGTVRDMIQTGWMFSHQALDATFLTSYLMCLTVMSAFTRQTAVIFNAEAQSGKSKFVGGLISGASFPRIHLVAHSVGMHGYSAAAIRQQRNNSVLCLVLEEFEDLGGNDKKSSITRNVLDMTRDLVGENAVNWSIGTTTGESRTYVLRFPLVCAAIRPLRDAASLSRFIAFELVHEAGRIDPVTALLDKFGDELIAQTRHEMAVAFIKHMPRLRQIQLEVEKEYATGLTLPSHVPARFREALFPILAMIRFVEEEAAKRGEKLPGVESYRKFAYDFSESRKEQLSRLKVTSENEQIFEMVLSSAIQIANTDDNRVSWVTTIRVMLADLNKLDEINKTKKGVYFDKLNEWLVVNWIEATQGVLANTKYRSETPTFLKQVSERSPHHVSQQQARAARVLDRLVEAMGPCQSWDLVTVFSVKHILDAARKTREEALNSTTGNNGSAAPAEKKLEPGPPSNGQPFPGDMEV